MASTDKGDDGTPPAEEEISTHVDRDGVRGLGEELLRANAHVAAKTMCDFDKNRCVWSHLFSRLVPPNDVLKKTVSSFIDVTPLLGHGEHLVDIVIRRASHAEWTEWRHTSLVLAAKAGKSDVFSKLLELDRGCMAVHASSLMNAAATGGSHTVLSVLLGPDAGSVSEQVDTLSAAARATATGTERNHGAKSPLQIAATEGHSGFVARLVEAGAPLNYMGMVGATALTMAIKKGHKNVVLVLLARGADPNKVNDGCSASAAKNHRTIRFADYTPLGIAASKDHGDIIKALLDAGATLTTQHGIAHPLHLAARAGACRPIAQLLQAGAGVNVVDTRGRTTLHHACTSVGWVDAAKYMGAIEKLLISGANVNALDALGRTPLYYAFVSRVTGIALDNSPIDRLLLAGADVGIVDTLGRSPLHWASCTNRREAVKSLLRLNADEMLVDNRGKTPMDLIAVFLQSYLLPNENGDGYSRTLSADQITTAEEIRQLFKRAPVDRAWRRRGWLVMMRARQHTNSLDARSDDVSMAVATVSAADNFLGTLPKLSEEGNTEGEVGAISCFYETVMWTVRYLIEEEIFKQVVLFL